MVFGDSCVFCHKMGDEIDIVSLVFDDGTDDESDVTFKNAWGSQSTEVHALKVKLGGKTYTRDDSTEGRREQDSEPVPPVAVHSDPPRRRTKHPKRRRRPCRGNRSYHRNTHRNRPYCDVKQNTAQMVECALNMYSHSDDQFAQIVKDYERMTSGPVDAFEKIESFARWFGRDLSRDLMLYTIATDRMVNTSFHRHRLRLERRSQNRSNGYQRRHSDNGHRREGQRHEHSHDIHPITNNWVE